jgi:hypothetical protein
MIQIKDVLAQMEQMDRSGRLIPFAIDFVTYNERTGAAGDVMKFAKATLVFPNTTGTRKFNPKKFIARQELQVKVGKAPQHVRNGTINIQTDGGTITKCHIWLIRTFNGQRVTWHIHG